MWKHIDIKTGIIPDPNFERNLHKALDIFTGMYLERKTSENEWISVEMLLEKFLECDKMLKPIEQLKIKHRDITNYCFGKYPADFVQVYYNGDFVLKNYKFKKNVS